MTQSTRSVNEVAVELSLIKAMKDSLAVAEKNAKAELQEAVARGTAYATVPQLGEVGTVVVTADSQGTWQVVDEGAFVAWVKEHRPSAIIESVRESDKKSILADIEKAGVLPDGVDLGEGRAGYVTVKQTPLQRATLVQAYRDDVGWLLGMHDPDLLTGIEG